MEFKELVSKRRAYRKLEKINVTDELIKELMEVVKLAPSCNNNQPWRFVFVYDQEKLDEVNKTFELQNKWAKTASLLIGVFSKPDLDCQIKGRDYYLFDTGIAVSYLILRATEMGLTAHPTSYFDEQRAKEAMEIPSDMKLISILTVGKRKDSDKINLSSEQEQSEIKRPKRFSAQYISYLNNYVGEYEENKKRFSSIFDES
ncbi:MAG: nitroreductase family protein [Candidatus Heimdallarchaeota archaeon]|nr:nitroreductase family protein [Candidatus Heimdallarchaeota archaeon]